MEVKKLLVTGAGGFIGSRLVRAACAAGWDTAGLWHATRPPQAFTGYSALPVDITDENAVASLFEVFRPSVVVHCAAVAGINICADDKNRAAAVNMEGTRHIVNSATRAGAYFVYVSTDLVFDGKKGYYDENDLPSPSCYYGETKYAGELITQSAGCRYAIARIATVYGHDLASSANFLYKLLERLRQNQTVELFDDEYRSFVYVDDVCAKLLKLADCQVNGIFHIAGPERLSTYSFGLRAAACRGFDHAMIRPVSSSKSPVTANRPKDCSLSSEKTVIRLGGFQPVEKALSTNF